MGDAGPGSPPRLARPPRSGLHPGQPAATAGQRGAPGVWRARGSLEWVQLELLLQQRRKLRHRGAGVDRGRDWVSHFWLLIRAPPATSLLPKPLLQREPSASGSKGPSSRPAPREAGGHDGFGRQLKGISPGPGSAQQTPTTQETGAPSLPAGSAQLKHYRNSPFSLLSSFPAAPPQAGWR